MTNLKVLFFTLIFFAFTHPSAAAVSPDDLRETRYGGAPERNADGTIHRSRAVLVAFQKIHPCPSTGKTSGACPGWALDHVVSLDCGGRDAVSNLQWLPLQLKTCAGICKDRWERKVYAASPPYPDTTSCRNVVLP